MGFSLESATGHRDTGSTEASSACTLCGESDPACTCANLRERILASAHRLLSNGTAAALRGEYSLGLSLLNRCLALDGSLHTAREAAGLCAFAHGDVSQAHGHWRLAAAHDPNGPAARWIDSLHGGTLGQIVAQYNLALDLTRDGRQAEALTHLVEVGEACPELLPALRAEGLVRRALGVRTGAGAWQRRALAWSSDPVVKALLADSGDEGTVPIARTRRQARVQRAGWAAAGAVAAAGGLLVIESVLSRDAARTPTTTITPSSAVIVRVGAASGASSSAVGIPTGGAPASLRHAYRTGRDAYTAGDDTVAAAQLALAAGVNREAYFADDAIYLLLLVQQRAGDTTAAGFTARRLLADHPSSPFSNSRARRAASHAARIP